MGAKASHQGAACRRENISMTSTEVVFRYGEAPGINELRAIDSVREVYGIRRVQWQEAERRVRVEYDASRLSEAVVAGLLRRAGIDLQEKLALT
jgi:hypothetical protein